MHNILFIALLLLSLSAWSQEGKVLIKEGNQLYGNGKYAEAEKKYQQAMQQAPHLSESEFNQADALYQQQRYEEAAAQFLNIASKATDKHKKADAYHNLGNSLLKTEKYDESVKAYKNALRNNPNDEDTRYNLAYAMRKLQQQQQQQQQNKDQKKQDKDKKDEQKQDQQQKDQQKQDQKEQQQQKKEEQQQQQKQEQQQQGEQQQAKKNELSKEDAERLLKALNQDERKVQEKLRKQKLKGVKVKIEKDW